MLVVQLMCLLHILNYCIVVADQSQCSVNKESLTCNYIPVDIPDGIRSVYIQNISAKDENFEIIGEQFHGKNWKRISNFQIYDRSEIHFTLRNKSLTVLTQLKEFRINSDVTLVIEPDALLGLEYLNILDFSGCARLTLDMIMKAVTGAEHVPRLEHLKLSHVQLFRQPGLRIDRKFSKLLSEKPLNTLDLSNTHIAVVDTCIFKDMKHLKVFNLSGAIVDENKECEDFTDVTRLSIDMSHSTTSTFVSTRSILANTQVPMSESAILLLQVKTLNMSGVLKGSDLRFYNIKVTASIKTKASTNELILKQNRLKYFDVEFKCDNLDFSSIKLLDLADNGMEYFNPSFLTCLSNLDHLHLEKNELNVMQQEHGEKFGQLLNNSENLSFISLANNNLSNITEDFFMGSKNLKNILLAGNKLTQVHFKLNHLKSLRFIDLSNNNIKILDALSTKQLDALRIDGEPNVQINNTITPDSYYTSAHRKVKVIGNPFMCNTCNSKSSILWLLSTKLTESNPNELTCKDESGTQIKLTDAVTGIQNICDREMKIVVLSTTIVVGIAMCIVVVVLVHYKRKQGQRLKRRNNIIELLKQEEDRFPVFLSYSSEDDGFVNDYVIEPLNEGLQRLLDISRNLICIGDIEFRLGTYVHNESLRNIERCSVFLCVVSESYCNSRYCCEEFNQAIQTSIPVILMMKGEVDIELMTPRMKLLFRNQVRMLWEEDNGEYRLKTTWDNVCKSIMDIAAN